MSQSAWSVMPANAAIHDPVLAHEVVALLDVAPGLRIARGDVLPFIALTDLL